MIILCPNHEPCTDDAASLGSFSSETPDVLLFRSFYFKGQIWNGEYDSWNACSGLCSSAISQADADQCATNNAAICEAHPPDPPPVPINYNPPGHANPSGPVPSSPPPNNPPSSPLKLPCQEVTCTLPCTDGGKSTTVKAGFLWGANQLDADQRAQSICELNLANIGCLTDLPTVSCIDVDFGTHYVTLDNFDTTPVLSWQLFGALPTGLSIVYQSAQAIITGTPTASGSFSFQLVATDADGSISWRTYDMRIMEISTPAILPDGEDAVAYSVTLLTVGSILPISWTLAIGSSLPAGLFLEESTGEIHGTPTVPGDYIFTIQAQDEAT